MRDSEQSSDRDTHSSTVANYRTSFASRLPDTAWQLGFLFAVDMVTNAIDFGFHVYLGRALSPDAFAVVQSVNAVLLIVVTTFAVLQPVVARYTAQASAGEANIRPGAIFQAYLRQSIFLGVVFIALILILRHSIAGWLNIPAAALTATSLMALLALVRPVVAGILQGLQRFVAFGLTRTVYAFARFILALVLIGLLGGGAVAGVATMPLAALASLGTGLFFLGRGVWKKTDKLPRQLLWKGWKLSLAALLAYAAFMGLQNVDLIWVNRLFEADEAGIYASLVVLRRVLVVLPGAVTVILFPRVVTRVTQGIVPDSPLAKAAALIMTTGTIITILYFFFGSSLLEVIFGPGYQTSSALLGWMGVAMIGFGLAAIWLNVFLATQPWPFVVLLLAAFLGQMALLETRATTIESVSAIFVISGWFLALGGLALYLAWLRPRLSRQPVEKEPNNEL